MGRRGKLVDKQTCFGLNMNSDVELERFIGTDPEEVSELVKRSEERTQAEGALGSESAVPPKLGQRSPTADDQLRS